MITSSASPSLRCPSAAQSLSRNATPVLSSAAERAPSARACSLSALAPSSSSASTVWSPRWSTASATRGSSLRWRRWKRTRLGWVVVAFAEAHRGGARRVVRLGCGASRSDRASPRLLRKSAAVERSVRPADAPAADTVKPLRSRATTPNAAAVRPLPAGGRRAPRRAASEGVRLLLSSASSSSHEPVSGARGLAPRLYRHSRTASSCRRRASRGAPCGTSGPCGRSAKGGGSGACEGEDADADRDDAQRGDDIAPARPLNAPPNARVGSEAWSVGSRAR